MKIIQNKTYAVSRCIALYWSRCFGRVREGILGHPAEIWEASWGVLGGPGGILGGSWAVLGRSWNDFLSSSIFDRFLDRFWSPKGCPKGGILGAKMVPKSIPKRVQIEVYFQERQNTLQDRLNTVLEPSWADLEPS